MQLSFNSNMFRGLRRGRVKFGLGSFILVLVIGGVFIVLGLLVLTSVLTVNPDWTKTQGEIVDSKSNISEGSTMYTGIVGYTVDGKDYQISQGYSSSAMPSIGKEVEIAYDPSRPSHAKVLGFSGGSMLILLFPLLGLAMIIFSIFAYVRQLKRTNTISKLMQTGHKLQGVIVDVRVVNNGNYVVTAAAPDSSGNVRNYPSDTVGGMGSIAMMDFRSNPVPVDVYIDPVNANEYYVDVSGLPNLTPQRIAELVQSTLSRSQSQPGQVMNASQPSQQAYPQGISQQTQPQPQQPQPVYPQGTGQSQQPQPVYPQGTGQSQQGYPQANMQQPQPQQTYSQDGSQQQPPTPPLFR